jgi:hypothetical protein
MAKSPVILNAEQKRRNAEILARLEMEKRRLVADTRALQEKYRCQGEEEIREGKNGRLSC